MPAGACDRSRSPSTCSRAPKPSRSFYFDWRANKKAQDKFDAAFTPAVSLIKSLDVALGLMLDDGLEAAFERHIRLGRAARAGIKAMGLELFSPDDDTVGRRHRRPRARRASTATSCCCTCATATASRSRRARRT